VGQKPVWAQTIGNPGTAYATGFLKKAGCACSGFASNALKLFANTLGSLVFFLKAFCPL